MFKLYVLSLIWAIFCLSHCSFATFGFTSFNIQGSSWSFRILSRHLSGITIVEQINKEILKEYHCWVITILDILILLKESYSRDTTVVKKCSKISKCLKPSNGLFGITQWKELNWHVKGCVYVQLLLLQGRNEVPLFSSVVEVLSSLKTKGC